MTQSAKSAFADKKMLGRAIKDSFIKLNPKTQVKNPVMLLVYISAILTSGLWLVSLFGIKDASNGYTLAIAVILWFTCIFANFAEAIAEVEAKFAGEGRVLIRPSGTEPLVRVMIEGKDQQLIESEAQKLAELISSIML